MRFLILAACGFASWPCFGADPAKPPAAHDFVFLAEARPVLVRVFARVNGKPVQAAWDEFMKQHFAALDANKDGVLDKAEAERVPTAAQIFSGGLAPIVGGGAAAAKPEDLDADKDGKITFAELTNYYRGKGLAPFQFQLSAPVNPLAAAGLGRAEPSVRAVADASFGLLDANKDGELSPADLAAATTALLARDTDGDEIVTARELVPNTKAVGGAMMMLGGRMASQSPDGLNVIVPVPPSSESLDKLVMAIQDRYGPKSGKTEEKKLKRSELGLGEAAFARLDMNKDGRLDAKELPALVKGPADLEFVVSFEGKEESARVESLPAPLASKVKGNGGMTLLDLGVTRLALQAVAADKAEGFGTYIEQQLGTLVKQADANGDGVIDAKEGEKSQFRALFKMMDRNHDAKVTEAELNGYFADARALQQRAEAVCVTLVVTDQSRGLFDLLDADRDGRLSVREMRGASKLLNEFDRGQKGHLTDADLARTYEAKLRPGPADAGALGGIGAVLALYRGAGDYDATPAPTKGPTWFRKMDSNRDGDVSRKEFLFSEEQFRRLDSDGDGLISADEAMKASAQSGAGQAR